LETAITITADADGRTRPCGKSPAGRARPGDARAAQHGEAGEPPGPGALLLQGICRPFRLLSSDDGRLNERPAERARLDGLQQTEAQLLPS
jgi:hypothetical protein